MSATETIEQPLDFEQVFEHSPDAIFIEDLEGNVLAANQAACDLHEMPREELVGVNVLDLVPPEARDVVAREFPGWSTGELQAYDGYSYTRHGRAVPVEIRCRHIEYGGKPALLLHVREVAQRRQAEDALRESERSLREAQRIAHMGSWLWDLQTGEVAWSDEAYRLFGLEPGRTEMTFDRFLSMVHPDDREGVRGRVEEALASGQDYMNEYRAVGVDGRERTMFSRGQVLRDMDGNPHIFRGSIVDITDRKKAEEERKALQTQIQYAQKLESLGVLAGGIAHDFNNLLLGILGNAELAMDGLDPASTTSEHLGEIEMAAKRAADLCRQMLAYSGRGTFKIEPISLNQVIEEMGKLLARTLSKKAQLSFDLDPELPAVEADAAQIQQIVLNLITNASEALGENGGTVSVRTGVIVCSSEYLAGAWLSPALPAGRYVRLEVIDNGCGMTEETRRKIFDPFFTTKFTGRGLGLAAVLGIVRGHKGAIEVCSERGKGTTFQVLFPESAAPVPAPGIEGEGEDGWTGSGTVLLVDDEDAVRRVADHMLRRLGFSVLTAGDGREAVAVFREHADDIVSVVLDLTMPVMDGDEAARQILAIRDNVPILLSSGYNEQDIAGRFAGTAVVDFIEKPYEMSLIRAKLRAALEC